MAAPITPLPSTASPKSLFDQAFKTKNPTHRTGNYRWPTTAPLLNIFRKSPPGIAIYSWKIVSPPPKKKKIRRVNNGWDRADSQDATGLSTASVVHRTSRGSAAGLSDGHSINTGQGGAEGTQGCLVWLELGGTHHFRFAMLKCLHIFAKSANFPYQIWNPSSLWNTHFHPPPSAKKHLTNMNIRCQLGKERRARRKHHLIPTAASRTSVCQCEVVVIVKIVFQVALGSTEWLQVRGKLLIAISGLKRYCNGDSASLERCMLVSY